MSSRVTRSNSKRSAAASKAGSSGRAPSAPHLVCEDIAASSAATPESGAKSGKQKKATKNAQATRKKPPLRVSRRTKKVVISTTRDQEENVDDPLPFNTCDNVLATEMYLDCLPEVHPNIESDESPQASGTSIEACHSSRGTSVFQSSPLIYKCDKCPKSSFTSKHGLSKHVMAHRVKDANAKRPSAVKLEPLVEGFVLKILREMIKEPGLEKQTCVSAILKFEDTDDKTEWCTFLEIMSRPFLSSLSKPTKLLPTNQYEEQLLYLNKILNNKEEVNKLVTALETLVKDQDISIKILKMVLYRVCSKFVDEICQFIFKEMLQDKAVDDFSEIRDMSKIEEEAFILHTRKLLQEYYKKGLQFGSKLWLARCACIRQNFISSSELSEAPSVDDFLNNSSWVEDDSGFVKLKLNSVVRTFFLTLERIIESMLRNRVQINSENVMDIVFQTCSMLDSWYSLTKDYFSEVEALLFLKDIVIVVISLSLKLEVNRQRNLLSTQRIQKYALRTDLKRN